MQKHKCIYCLQIKDEFEFNREHVVPQMMGKYQNGFVLSDFQVCQECNTYFSEQMENKIALDSYEALLRMQYRDTPMSDGRKLKGNRIRLIGDEGIFKGIPFSVITEKSSPYRVRFESEPMVGIINSNEKHECDYYPLENLPNVTAEVMKRMKESTQPIINSGIDRELLEPVLIEKGYLVGQYTYSEKSVLDLYKEPEFITAINMKIDPIMRRVCAKTVFNYLCYSRGKEFVIDSTFDAIREYIRYGNWSDQLWFRYSKGPVTTVEVPNDTAHVVGYMWYPEEGQWIFCGCLTWFGDLTYIFKLGETSQRVQKVNALDSTKMACFNNVDRTIAEDDAVHIFQRRPDGD
jgi:hypothetical protein